MTLPPFQPEVLLRNEAALASLARSLVRDTHAADDLVQQAWLDLLTRPPRLAANVGAWLHRVVRSRSLNRLRDEARRRSRERRVARPERIAATDEVVAAREMRRRVVVVLSSVPKNYRVVLMLRYFADQTPGEIAAQLGVPPSTVKSQLRRGLQMLRERLEGSQSDGHRGLLGGLALVAGSSPSFARAASDSLWRWGLVSAAVAAAVTAAVVLPSSEEEAGTVVAPAVAPARSLGSITSVPVVVRELQAPPPERPPAVALAPRSQNADTDRIEGVVVDSEGEPVAGVDLSFWWDFPDPLGDHAADPPEPAANPYMLKTDAEGRFSREIEPERYRTNRLARTYFAMDAQRQRGAFLFLGPEPPTEPLTVQLRPLSAIVGRLVPAGGRKAPAKMAASLRLTESWPLVLRCVTTSQQFRLLAPPGSYGLGYTTEALGLFASRGVASLASFRMADSPLDLGDVVIEIPDLLTLRGTILGEGGEPAAGASVGGFWTADTSRGRARPSSGATANQRGEVELTLERPKDGRALVLSARSLTGSHAALFTLEAEDWERRFDVHLEPAVQVKGNFELPTGLEVPPWTNVYIESLEPRRRILRCMSNESRFVFTLPPGEYHFSGYGSNLLQETNFLLEVPAGSRALDLGALPLLAHPGAVLVGKAAPEWTVEALKPLPRGDRLRDYRGQWVLLEFWSYG